MVMVRRQRLRLLLRLSTMYVRRQYIVGATCSIGRIGVPRHGFRDLDDISTIRAVSLKLAADIPGLNGPRTLVTSFSYLGGTHDRNA
jgi:hypothetical protein